MTDPQHLACQAFRVGVRRILPSASALEFEATYTRRLGLVIRVTALEPWRFNPAFLAQGPAAGRPLLTDEGRHLWKRLRELGNAAIRLHGAADDLPFIVLDSRAVDSARAHLKLKDVAA